METNHLKKAYLGSLPREKWPKKTRSMAAWKSEGCQQWQRVLPDCTVLPHRRVLLPCPSEQTMSCCVAASFRGDSCAGSGPAAAQWWEYKSR